MSILHYLQGFFEELRYEGIPVTTSQVRDCCQALLLVDWSNQTYFYSTMLATLVKDYAYQPAFDEVFHNYFDAENMAGFLRRSRITGLKPEEEFFEEDTMVSDFDLGMGSPMGNSSSAHSPGGKKNPLDQDFSLASLDDIRKLEALFPLMARRLASKFIKKKKMNDHNTLDFRRTIRNSMSTGGIPVNIFTIQKSKEKSVILTLSDVSGSVMNFSCFSLALVASLEKFFRQIHSFAFIDEVDDITGLLLKGDPLNLRRHVLEKSKVIGQRGYTNYGFSLRAFYERHRRFLTPKTTLLIFGDGRNNWFEIEAGILQEIRRQVKKVYWFNPENELLWGTGDSVMQVYAEACDKAFACPTMLELEKALSQI